MALQQPRRKWRDIVIEPQILQRDVVALVGCVCKMSDSDTGDRSLALTKYFNPNRDIFVPKPNRTFTAEAQDQNHFCNSDGSPTNDVILPNGTSDRGCLTDFCCSRRQLQNTYGTLSLNSEDLLFI